jgi:hypothetical protein
MIECIKKILQKEYLDVRGRKWQQNWMEQYNNIMITKSPNNARIRE